MATFAELGIPFRSSSGNMPLAVADLSGDRRPGMTGGGRRDGVATIESLGDSMNPRLLTVILAYSSPVVVPGRPRPRRIAIHPAVAPPRLLGNLSTLRNKCLSS